MKEQIHPGSTIPGHSLGSALKRIWWKPRKTVETMVKAPSMGMTLRILISWIFGFVLCMNYTLWGAPSFERLSFIMKASLIAAPLLGYFALSFIAIMFYWTGKIVAGEARYKQVEAAVIGSAAPFVWMTLSMLACIAVYGKGFFDFSFWYLRDELWDFFTIQSYDIFEVLYFAQYALVLWGVVAFVNAYAKVQKLTRTSMMVNILLASIAGYIMAMILLFCLLMIGLYFQFVILPYIT